jgi:hypothetical protein
MRRLREATTPELGDLEMRTVMVRYKVKAERAAENERYVGEVFAQLERERPPGVRYATFKADDGVSFVHLASIDAPEGVNPLTELSAFKAFTAGVKERCEEPPVTTRLNRVGSYEFLGEHATKN